MFKPYLQTLKKIKTMPTGYTEDIINDEEEQENRFSELNYFDDYPYKFLKAVKKCLNDPERLKIVKEKLELTSLSFFSTEEDEDKQMQIWVQDEKELEFLIEELNKLDIEELIKKEEEKKEDSFMNNYWDVVKSFVNRNKGKKISL